MVPCVEYWIDSNETNTDAHMYIWRIYSYLDVVALLYVDEVRYEMECTLVYIQMSEYTGEHMRMTLRCIEVNRVEKALGQH